MSKKLLSNELLIGIAAMIISLSTLLVFAYQTHLIRKQQFRSVYPHLNLIHMNSGSADYQFVLRNQGIGPAFITALKVKEPNGKTYDNLVQYMRHKIAKKDSIRWKYSDLSIGALVQEKEEVILFELFDGEDSVSPGHQKNALQAANKLRQILTNDSLQITISYKSIYEESWTINNSSMPIKN